MSGMQEPGTSSKIRPEGGWTARRVRPSSEREIIREPRQTRINLERLEEERERENEREGGVGRGGARLIQTRESLWTRGKHDLHHDDYCLSSRPKCLRVDPRVSYNTRGDTRVAHGRDVCRTRYLANKTTWWFRHPRVKRLQRRDQLGWSNREEKS